MITSASFQLLNNYRVSHFLSVIKHLKDIFTEIGIPRCIVSDGGTQFTSQKFQDFTRTWGIHHKVTSPTNAQSNGQAECFVQIIKNSLSKAIEGGEDLHLAILAYATTPLNHSLPSPAELLNSRKIQMHPTGSDQTAKSHPQVQEHNAKTKMATNKLFQQKCKGFAQSQDWKASLCATSPKDKKLDTRSTSSKD